MSKAKFTPGPWVNNGYNIEAQECSFDLAKVTVFNQGKANSHLIASAPEMYAKIESDIKRIEAQMMFKTKNDETLPGLKELRDRKLALLAKSRGES